MAWLSASVWRNVCFLEREPRASPGSQRRWRQRRQTPRVASAFPFQADLPGETEARASRS